MFNKQCSMNNDPKYDLEDRLIDFAVMVLDVTEKLPKTTAGLHVAGQLVRSGTSPAANYGEVQGAESRKDLHVAGQLVRSGTSPAANYGEVQGAESRKDFIHKFGIVLKELKESRVWLKIIHRKKYLSPGIIDSVLNECCELIQISGKSISTARKNQSNS